MNFEILLLLVLLVIFSCELIHVFRSWEIEMSMDGEDLKMVLTVIVEDTVPYQHSYLNFVSKLKLGITRLLEGLERV